MRKSNLKRLAAVPSVEDALPRPSEVTVHEVSSDDPPVGSCRAIPPREQEKLSKHQELMKALAVEMGLQDYAVAMTESRRNDLRQEYQKLLLANETLMKNAGRLAGFDIDGDGKYSVDLVQMKITRVG